MIWVDREVKKIIEKNNKSQWVDDMKTPSGRIHVGSLWGVTIHDLIYKVLLENNIKTNFTYVFNDMDQMDAIPSYLHYAQWQKHSGEPLYKIPSPEKGFKSFAEYYAFEFRDTFNKLNCHPQILWSHELYESGKMDDCIKIVLDNAPVVREIYRDISKAHKADDWYPFQPICEKCGKIGTTETYNWDGKHIYYRCKVNLVKWAEGCGHEGRVSPYGGTGKLHWRLDWPSHWNVIGVTVEGSGKDHMSSGGSYDFASEVMKRIFKKGPPYAVAYEWFTIGGKKMSSSKGIGTAAKDIAMIIPPELLRFLMVRTPISSHLDFDPTKPETIPNLFDDYDRCLDAYFTKSENKLPKGKPGEVMADFARVMQLSEVKPLPDARIYVIRFRTLVNLIKTNTDIMTYAKKQKGVDLTDVEKEWLEERTVYAEKYLADQKAYHKQEEHNHHHANKLPILKENEKQFTTSLAKELSKHSSYTEDELKVLIFDVIKKTDIKPRDAFRALYIALTGKESGPHANELILETGIEKSITLLKNAGTTSEKKETTSMFHYPDLKNPSLFSIDPALAKEYPTLSIGIAVIKNVTVGKTPVTLKKEIDAYVETQQSLNNELISSYPEVLSYRKLYKEMGIDWHSRRPSPEALLRRIALKKGLYSVNSCVDAYNLIVMKNRVSIGAFDYNLFELPTVLRRPHQGEEILLLGETNPTQYTEKEIAYFDKKGGYNIDFNYRDAQRTAVSEKTKNIVLNVDGVFDITRTQVEKSLKESIDMILKYCGGEVETIGIASSK